MQYTQTQRVTDQKKVSQCRLTEPVRCQKNPSSTLSTHTSAPPLSLRRDDTNPRRICHPHQCSRAPTAPNPQNQSHQHTNPLRDVYTHTHIHIQHTTQYTPHTSPPYYHYITSPPHHILTPSHHHPTNHISSHLAREGILSSSPDLHCQPPDEPHTARPPLHPIAAHCNIASITHPPSHALRSYASPHAMTSCYQHTPTSLPSSMPTSHGARPTMHAALPDPACNLATQLQCNTGSLQRGPAGAMPDHGTPKRNCPLARGLPCDMPLSGGGWS